MKFHPYDMIFPSNITLQIGSQWFNKFFGRNFPSHIVLANSRNTLPNASDFQVYSGPNTWSLDLKFTGIKPKLLASTHILLNPIWSLQVYERDLGKLVRSLGALLPAP